MTCLAAEDQPSQIDAENLCVLGSVRCVYVFYVLYPSEEFRISAHEPHSVRALSEGEERREKRERKRGKREETSSVCSSRVPISLLTGILQLDEEVFSKAGSSVSLQHRKSARADDVHLALIRGEYCKKK